MNLRSYAKARLAHKLKTQCKRARKLVSPVERKPFTETLIRTEAPPNQERGALVIRNVCLADTPADHRVRIEIKAGLITAVSPENGSELKIEPGARLIDGNGAAVLPGFTDSHVHLIVGAEQSQGCDVDGVKSKEELLDRIGKYAKDHSDVPVVYAYGLRYQDPPLLDPKKARFELSGCVQDHRPVFVYAHDLHTGWASTEALEECDLLHPMPPYPRVLEELDMTGNIELGEEGPEKGIPTGELREPETYFLVDAALRSKYPQTCKEKLSALYDACHDLAKLGITSVHNMGLTLPEEDLELLLLALELEEKDRLPIRVHSSYSVVPDELMLEDVDAAADLRDKMLAARQGKLGADELYQYLMEKLEQAVATQRWLSDPAAAGDTPPDHPHAAVAPIHLQSHRDCFERRLQETRAAGKLPIGKVFMNAVKVFMDGVIEQDTAYRTDSEPVEGIPAFDSCELGQTVQRADRLGLAVRAHCIGDGSVQAMLDAVEAARSANAKADTLRGHRIRHRVEHIELCRPDDIPRFSAFEAAPSMQPFHERQPSDPPSLWFQKVPEKEWETAFPWKSLVGTGAPLVFGSDWPIVSCDCLEAMRHAISRTPWKEGMKNQGLSFPEAAAGFCSNPAYAVYEEQVAGQIEPGMIADLVILSHDLGPDGTDLDQTTKVLCTICDGEVVYESKE